MELLTNAELIDNLTEVAGQALTSGNTDQVGCFSREPASFTAAE